MCFLTRSFKPSALLYHTSLCFLAALSPREPVEPLDEELPVVEQLLDI